MVSLYCGLTVAIRSKVEAAFLRPYKTFRRLCIRARLLVGPQRMERELGFRVCVRTRFLKGTGLGGGKESQVTRRNQSRRDGTICSPARECRVGFHANRVPKGRHNAVLTQTL